MEFSLSDVIAWKYPKKEIVLRGDFMEYDSVEWCDGIPISREDISADVVEFAKFLRTQEIQEIAMNNVEEILIKSCGSSRTKQQLIYSQKVKEAVRVVHGHEQDAFMLSNEAAITGENLYDLAKHVLAQHSTLGNLTNIAIGKVEGQRRMLTKELNALNTLDSIKNYNIRWNHVALH
jgi:hypothetical protein